MLKNKERNSNIELLRLYLMGSILISHVIVHGMNLKNIGGENFSFVGNIPITLIVISLFTPSVYCFIFISGFYGIRFSLRKLFSLVLWCVLVQIFCTLITLFGGEGNIDFSFYRDIIKILFPISTYQWWFMSEYILLFILSPFINLGIKRLHKRTLDIVICSLFTYMVTSFIFKWQWSGGSNLICLLTIYILARYMNCFNVTISFKRSMVLFVLCSLALVGISLLLYILVDIGKLPKVFLKGEMLLWNYNNPLIILMAISLFYIVNDIKPVSIFWLNKLIAPSLFIYLFSEKFYVQLYTPLAFAFQNNILIGLLYCGLFISVSLVLGRLIMIFTDFILNKIANFILYNNI